MNSASSFRTELQKQAVLPFRRAALPGPVRACDLSRQDGVSNLVDPHQAAWRGTAPLEASRIRTPVKQGDAPGGNVASSFVVDETMIGRAARRHQPAARQQGAVRGGAGGLKLGSGLSDVERRTAEQLPQRVRDPERQTSN